MLTTVALLAAPSKPEDAATRAQTTLRKVSQLSADEQRAWLRQVERRLAWAAKLTMKPDEAEKEQARVATLLRQKSVSWPTLIDLLRLLEQREKAAIGRLVRQYRSQVYESFRRQDRALMERQEAWYRVWSLWEAAGSPADQQDRLLDWLEAAIHNSMPNSIGPIPPDPKFGEGTDLAPSVAAKKPTEEPAARPKPPEVAPPPKGPTAETRPGTPPAERPSTPAEKPQDQPSQITARPMEPAPVTVRVPDSRIPSTESKPAPDRVVPHRAEGTSPGSPPPSLPSVVLPPQRIVQGPATEQINTARPLEMTSRPTVLPPNLGTTASPDVFIADAPAQKPPAAIARLEPQGDTRQPPELPKPRSFQGELPDKPEPSRPPVAAQPRPQLQPALTPPWEEGKRPPLRPEHDMTAMLPRNVPDALPLDGPSEQPHSPVAEPAKEPKAPSEEHVQVNVEELSARIAGINLALRTLEAQLDEKREWNADELDRILNRLDILVLRQKDLNLFRELVTPAEQAKAGQIESPRQAITALAARIVAVRNRIRSSETGAESERQASLKQLDDLSDRLAALATEK